MDDRIESWVQRGKELAEECFTGGAVAEGCCRVGEDDELREEVVSALVAHLRTTPEGYRLLKSGANLERENEALRKDARWRPQFDGMEPEQERLAIQFCEEIAGRRGEKGRAPDPVRLLEMAEALYKAEADAALKEQSKC